GLAVFVILGLGCMTNMSYGVVVSVFVPPDSAVKLSNFAVFVLFTLFATVCVGRVHVAWPQVAAAWPTFAVTVTRNVWSPEVSLIHFTGKVSVPFVASIVKPRSGNGVDEPTNSALTSDTKSMPVGRASESTPR